MSTTRRRPESVASRTSEPDDQGLARSSEKSSEYLMQIYQDVPIQLGAASEKPASTRGFTRVVLDVALIDALRGSRFKSA